MNRSCQRQASSSPRGGSNTPLWYRNLEEEEWRQAKQRWCLTTWKCCKFCNALACLNFIRRVSPPPPWSHKRNQILLSQKVNSTSDTHQPLCTASNWNRTCSCSLAPTVKDLKVQTKACYCKCGLLEGERWIIFITLATLSFRRSACVSQLTCKVLLLVPS